jgi:hypothetical protein
VNLIDQTLLIISSHGTTFYFVSIAYSAQRFLVSLVLLFRAEIITALQDLPTFYRYTGDRETQLYRCLSNAPDDILLGRNHKRIFIPVCHCLPKQYWPFQLPQCSIRTSFSTVGPTVNAKRSSLAPSTVDKVVFIQENAQFVNDSSE